MEEEDEEEGGGRRMVLRGEFFVVWNVEWEKFKGRGDKDAVTAVAIVVACVKDLPKWQWVPPAAGLSCHVAEPCHVWDLGNPYRFFSLLG